MSPPEEAESPDEIEHLVLVPVSWVDLPNLHSPAYAASLDQPVLAIFVGFDEDEVARMRHYWRVWGDHIPLETIISPYRLITLKDTSLRTAMVDRALGIFTALGA